MEFPKSNYRARCIKVVDGDTLDLEVDIGFHLREIGRFRVLGIDTAELHDKDPAKRALAVKAKETVTELMKTPVGVEWPLLVSTEKDPDNFGRWLISVQFEQNSLLVDLGQTLIGMGLAVPYVK